VFFRYSSILGFTSGFTHIHCVSKEVRMDSPMISLERRNSLFGARSRFRPLLLAEASSSSPASLNDNNELVAPTLSKWDPTNWTPKRLWNTPLFRYASILAVLAVAGLSTKSPLSKISKRAAATIHLLSFATWLGTNAWTTFVAGITMYKNLPRQTFGKLQSKLFPKYFLLCSVTIILQLVTLSYLPASPGVRALGIALAMTLVNQFYLEPTTSKNMLDRYEIENNGDVESDEYKKLKSSFGKMHGISSLTNLIALCAGVAHGTYLASALVI